MSRLAGRPRTPATILSIAAGVSLLGLIPLGYVIVTSLMTGWPTFSALVFRPRVGELLVNTVLLVVVTVPLCALVGLAAAWLIERTTLLGRRAFAVLLVAPLAIPAFVNSYGWVSLVPSLNGLWSGVLVAGLSYFPLVYLPCVAALRRLDPGIEEAAASLGLSPARVFLRVVLPQLRLSLLGGSLIIALHLLSEYGAFALIRFDTFTTAIVEQFRSTFNGPAATALASVLVTLCLLLLVGEAGGRGRSRYARVGSGSARPVPRHRLGVSRVAAFAFLGAIVLLSVVVPFASVTRWIVDGGAAAWANPLLPAALVQTLGYGLVGSVIAAAVAFPISILAVRYPSALAKGLESVNYVTSSLPGIVTALALVTVSIRLVPGIYQSALVVVVAYCLMFLPRAIVTLRAGLAQVPPGIEEAARSLGLRPSLTFASVTLRFVMPAAVAAAALVFLGVANELTATLLLAPNGTRTLATQFWSNVNDIDYAGAAPYATLLIVLSLPVTFLLFSRSKLVSAA